MVDERLQLPDDVAALQELVRSQARHYEEQLNQGKVPIYEPGLAELLVRNVAAARLHFTTELPAVTVAAELVYLAVGTPQADDGSAELR